MFEAVKNWGKWGPDDERGTMNYITPDKIAAAAALVQSGRTRLDGDPDQQGGRAGQSEPGRAPDVAHARHAGQRSGLSLRHVTSSAWPATATATPTSMRSATSPTRASSTTASPASRCSPRAARDWGSIAAYARGIVGRGVLLDCRALPRRRLAGAGRGGDPRRTRGDRGSRRACGSARGTSSSSAPAIIARRLALGAWSNDYPPAGEGKAGLHVDTIPWMHERRIAAFLPDGDGETVPSNVEGMLYPIHPLQVTAMGMLAADSLQLEDLAAACAEEGRFEFMVVGLPLRLPGAHRARRGTRSPSSESGRTRWRCTTRTKP